MSLEQLRAEAPVLCPPSSSTESADAALERRQREHELIHAYYAAKACAEALELAGLDDLADRAKRIRNAVAEEFAELNCPGGGA